MVSHLRSQSLCSRKGHILETVGKKANSVIDRMSQKRALDHQSKITLNSAFSKDCKIGVPGYRSLKNVNISDMMLGQIKCLYIV